MAEFRLGRLKFNWRGNWSTSTAYVIDDIVKFGANTYVCTTNHTSVSNEQQWYGTDLSNWSLHVEGITNRGEWQSGQYYKLNDIIKYGNTQYRVTTGFSTTGFSTSNMVEYLQSFNYEDTWSSATEYQTGDVVAYGGYTYTATSINTNKIPPYNLTGDWDILTTGFSAVGIWTGTTNYTQGDVSQFGGGSFVAITTSYNNEPTDSTKWKKIVDGVKWSGEWQSTITYQKGEAVKRLSSSYIGVATSGNINQDPSTDSSGTYWNSLVEGAANNVMTTQGDMVYYTTGAARLPKGTDGQVLAISSGGVPNWEDNSVTHPVYYVTEEGSDSNDGSNISRSFASVKYACGIATGPATVYVKAGTYVEDLPIVVPDGVSIVGDNLRTSKVTPNKGADSHYQIITLNSAPDAAYTPTAGTTYDPVSGDLVLRIGPHTFSTKDYIRIADNSLTFTCNYNGDSNSTQKTYPRPTGATGGSTNGSDYVQGKDIQILSVTHDTITVNVNGGYGAITDTSTHNFVNSVSGSITKPPTAVVSYGSTMRNGAGNKVCSVLDSDYSEKIIHIRPTIGGLWTTSDTWENGSADISITNVETLKNENSVMFFLGNATMLKDLLMDGMTGFVKAGVALTETGSIAGTDLTSNNLFPDLVGTTITGVGVSEGTKVTNFISSTKVEVNLSQSVSTTDLTYTASPDDPNNAITRGVFVQMNPESPIKKSPYVSNCSAQSVGGVGAIVDGGVHRQFRDDSNTPSNKSIVFDSFTNTHDNGMGFWVTDGGASEMVSSFTYYAHISYAATRGGRIRSLAGNSSWGTYGVISSGFSPLEKAREGTIEGLVLEYDPETRNGNNTGTDFSLNERIKGATSGAIGYINSIQGPKKEQIYYSPITEGPAGVGTGFAAGELITAVSTGTTAILINNTDANRGQSGFTIVASGLGTSPTLEPNGSIEFVSGAGNGGYNSENITGADAFTFVVSGVSQIGSDGRGTVNLTRGQWTTTGAAHTGGSTNIYRYPNKGNTATFLVPASSTDTSWSVSTISGFSPGEYLLTPTGELTKIISLDSANTLTVTREQDGAGIATSYVIGQTLTAIGASTLINNAEIFKDITGVSTSVRVTTAASFWDAKDDYIKVDNEFIKLSGVTTDTTGRTTLTLVEEKAAKAFDEQEFKIRYIFSQTRLTGHDFLQVGTGGTATTNWPSVPTQDPVQSQEVSENFPGRVFYVSTDQEGNFRVGKYFRVNQATGAATLNASAFDLSGLTSIRLGSIGAQLGASINEFSTDGTLSQNSNDKVPTQAAVRTYVGTRDAEHLVMAQNHATAGLATERSHTTSGIATAKFQGEVNAYFVGQS